MGEYWNGVMHRWNAMVGGGLPTGTGHGSTGDGLSGHGSTGDGRVQLSDRTLGRNEFRKLMEAFMRDHNHLPRSREEFERWLRN